MSENQPVPEAPRRRRHLSFEQAQALVVDWQASGLSAAAFVRSRGILRSTLASCRKRIGEAAAPAVAGEIGFVELRPANGSSAAIELSSGPLTLRIDAALAESLLPIVLRALREGPA